MDLFMRQASAHDLETPPGRGRATFARRRRAVDDLDRPIAYLEPRDAPTEKLCGRSRRLGPQHPRRAALALSLRSHSSPRPSRFFAYRSPGSGSQKDSTSDSAIAPPATAAAVVASCTAGG